MADRSVRVILTAVTSGFTAGMSTAAQSAKALGTGIERNSAQLNSLGNTSLLAGAALAAGVGLAVKSYADFDQQMSAVAATGQDAKANLDGLKEAALAAGAATKYSATEAAEGVENLLKAGVSASDVMGGGLSGALDLAAAGTMEVADAAEVAATAMTQFKLSGKDVPHIADLLSAGAGKAQGEVSDLAAALKQSGLVASQFGLSVEETTGTLAAFASAGLLGSDAGTSFKQMLLSLAAPSTKAKNLMAELGIAAYDAQGQFVGVSDLAQQLKDRLGPLSDAQRQAALATIFGSDAMRAASVLYDQGAAGIDQWTQAVTDQGFAAETAATKMDNLAGDLEKLKGSIETALIQGGEAADGPLRGIVQGLDGIVQAAAAAPPELQTVGLAIAGVGGSALLAVGGLMKAAASVTEFRGNLVALKDAMAAAKISGATLSLALGGIGAALALGGLALGQYLEKEATAKSVADQFKQSIEGQTDAINENSRAVAVKALQDTGAYDIAQKLGLSLTDVTQAAMGNADAQNRLNAAMRVQAQEASGSTDAMWSLNAEQLKLTDGIELTSGAFERGKVLAEQTAVANGQVETSSASLTGALKAQQEATEKANQALQDAANAQLAMSGTTIGLEAAIDSATEAVAEHGRNTNLDTEAGRANMTALNGIASSALSLREAQEKAGASTETMTASTNRAREAFIATAEKMGYAHDEAVRLADAYGLVPPTVVTNVSAPGAVQAKDEVDAAAQAARNADGTTATITITTNRITNIITRSDSQTVGGSLMGTYAGGGSIRGPGTATSDSIPAWLSNGEFVIRAAAVDKIGLDRLWYMNRFGQLPTFNGGGEVHWSNAAPRYAGGGSVLAASGPSAADVAAEVQALRADLGRGLGIRITHVDPIYDEFAGILLAGIGVA